MLDQHCAKTCIVITYDSVLTTLHVSILYGKQGHDGLQLIYFQVALLCKSYIYHSQVFLICLIPPSPQTSLVRATNWNVIVFVFYVVPPRSISLILVRRTPVRRRCWLGIHLALKELISFQCIDPLSLAHSLSPNASQQ